MDERRWTILVCPECGRDDRHTPIGRTKHWRGGVRCDGVPVAVVVGPVSPAVPVARLRDWIDGHIYSPVCGGQAVGAHGLLRLLDEYEGTTDARN